MFRPIGKYIKYNNLNSRSYKNVICRYEWDNDHQPLSYSNWAPGNPKNKAGNCVQLLADRANLGKWYDEPCDKVRVISKMGSYLEFGTS